LLLRDLRFLLIFLWSLKFFLNTLWFFIFPLFSILYSGHTSVYALGIMWHNLKALVNRFSHHEQPILWSLQVDNIWFWPFSISELFLQMLFLLILFLDIHSHKIKYLIDLIKNLTSSLVNRNCIIHSLNLLKGTLDVVVWYFCWHFFFLVKINS
jgi:hypothetical protein